MIRLFACALALAAIVPRLGAPTRAAAQTVRNADPLLDMIAAERAFAGRARTAGWKQAFLEYFADEAVGFDGEQVGSAKAQIRRQPDPPKGHQLLWEPRYGDIAASGDLGYLTGPSTSINPARNNGIPRHSNYASVWKRQPDDSFKVVMDVGVATPDPVAFPAGFTRAPREPGPTSGRGAQSAAASLREADSALTNAARKGQAEAYSKQLAADARLHRGGIMPIVGETPILMWMGSQPAYTGGDSRHAEAARSGDLGYTWGSYALPDEKGFYVRVWSRARDGSWKVALDVLQPQ